MRELELSDKERKLMRDLAGSISNELGALRCLDEDVKQLKNEDIKSMIGHYLGLTKNIEDRRIGVHNFALQLMVICLTAMGLLFGLEEPASSSPFWTVSPPLRMVMFILLVQILFSLLIVVVYEAQSWFRYPFLRLTEYGSNKWKWFYYVNEHILQINTRPISPSKKFDQTLGAYLQGFKEFTSNYRAEDLDREITDNIQQLYLLQVHNYYKNRFYLQLMRIRLWSIYATILVVLGFIAYWIYTVLA